MSEKSSKRALGRGLDALLPTKPAPTAHFGDGSMFTCPVEQIVPQEGQPRQHFDEEELAELAASIREHGVIEPIVVRKVAAPAKQRGGLPTNRYAIIAGERRWRASQRAGLRDVPIVVKDVSPRQAFEMALVENVQRTDLDAIEVAEAYDRLIREHEYTAESIAQKVGKNRTTVVNSLRLLKLPPRVRSLVISRELSEGHARALLGAPDDRAMNEIADKTIRGRLAVRAVERLIKQARQRAKPSRGRKEKVVEKSASVRDLETRLMRRLGTRTEVRDKDGMGELAIHYGSLDELDRLLALLGV